MSIINKKSIKKNSSNSSNKESFQRFLFQVPEDAFNEASLSEDKPVNIQILKKGKFKHPWFGVLSFDDYFFNNLISNFNANIPQENIAFDFKHIPDWGAAAWVNQVFVEDDALMASVSLTDRGRESIEKKEFMYFSIEYTDDYVEYSFEETEGEEGNTITREVKRSYGPTMLGGGLTNRPFIKGMKPISLSEDGEIIEFEEIEETNESHKTEGYGSMKKDLETLQTKQKELEDKIKELKGSNNEESKEEMKALSEKLEQVVIQVKELSESNDPEDKNKPKKEEKTLSEEEARKLSEDLENAKKQLSEKEEAVKKLSEDVASLTDSVKTLMESNKVLQHDKHKAEMERKLEEFKKKGAFPSTIKVIAPVLLSEASRKFSVTLSDEEGKDKKLSIVDVIDEILESIPEDYRFSDEEHSESVTTPTGSPKELSMEEVEAYAKENNVSLEEAIIHFSKEGRIPE